MTFLVIIFSLLLGAVFVGIPFGFLRSWIEDKVAPVPMKSAPLLKIGAALLILLNGYHAIMLIVNMARTYSSDWIAFDDAFGIAFGQIFSLMGYWCFIALAVALLIRSKALLASSSIGALVYVLLRMLFFSEGRWILYYTSHLPSVVTLLALGIVYLSVGNASPIFLKYKKLIKVAPFFCFLSYAEDIYIVLVNLIGHGVFAIPFRFSLIFPAIEFAAFFLIFKALIPLIDTENYSVDPISKKEKWLVAGALLVLPIVFYFISRINIAFLIIGLIFMAIGVPIAFAATANQGTKVRRIAVTATVVGIIAFLLLCSVVPTGGGDSDSDACGVCDGSGYVPDEGWGWETCPYCRGTGVPPI